MKEKLRFLYEAVDKNFVEQFGFQMKELSFVKIVNYLHMPKDSASLAVTRMLFGLAMLFDIPDERGGATMDRRWGDPTTCHFPLLPLLRALPMPYMAFVYAAMWFGALGIMLGYKYRLSSSIFTICYWYLLLIEKSFWNNHSYLFGLVGLLMTFTQANCYWSIDAYLHPTQLKETVPYWNYFLLKYQFFILYFMAGMKKGTAEWLTGYSVQKLSEHWVFDPFKLFLTVSQTDYLIVHWFVFLFDLTVALWMMMSRTRPLAMLLCALFHLMNSRLFRIGMFPWVCLATMPVFYPFNWPKTVLFFLKEHYLKFKKVICNRSHTFKNKKTCSIDENDGSYRNDGNDEVDNDKDCGDNIFSDGTDVDVKDSDDKLKDDETAKDGEEEDTALSVPVSKGIEKNKIERRFQDPITQEKNIYKDEAKHDIDDNTMHYKDNELRKKITTCIIFLYVLMQLFLPYSHFLTKGYNNWTNGLYGYSWDMMVHTWDTNSVVVKVVDNERNQQFFIDPFHYTPNDRWTRHGDMVYQYAQCVKENLIKVSDQTKWNEPLLSENISIYVDVWCSMNGRFTQRLFDPKVDLLKASWSIFESVSYLMPLLDEAVGWRSTLDNIRQEVFSWNNYSDVLFFADFPGYDLEKYISLDLRNVTLTVLEGQVVFEQEVNKHRIGQSYQLNSGNQIQVDSGLFHKVMNVGVKPAFYMYTFINVTEANVIDTDKKELKAKLPIFRELYLRLRSMVTFANLVIKNIFLICFRMTQCQ